MIKFFVKIDNINLDSGSKLGQNTGSGSKFSVYGSTTLVWSEINLLKLYFFICPRLSTISLLYQRPRLWPTSWKHPWDPRWDRSCVKYIFFLLMFQSPWFDVLPVSYSNINSHQKCYELVDSLNKNWFVLNKKFFLPSCLLFRIFVN